MQNALHSSAREMIDAVVERIQERLPEEQRDLAAAFAEHYFRGTAAQDLAELEHANLYGAVLSHFNLAYQHKTGQPHLHAYNPQLEQHGWQSTHTVVEIVCDDSPFLVDSVRMAINDLGLTCHLIVHPVFRVARDDDGHLTEILDGDEGGALEAVMHFEIDRVTDETLGELEQSIGATLARVHRVVGDWRPMRERLVTLIEEIEKGPPTVSEEELAESLDFLRWLTEDHFTFLGSREYTLSSGDDGESLDPVEGSGLGLLGEDESEAGRGFAQLDEAGRRKALAPELLVVTKTSRRAPVHRRAFMDYVGIKRFDGDGRVTGEVRFLGLYAAAAYNRNVREIPLLRRKVNTVLERTHYPPGSHARRALLNILESYPRDELFQISVDDLYRISIGILHLQERQRVRLFVRRDGYGRFYSCLVFVPRDRFSTEVRLAMITVFERAIGGECLDFNLQISESVLARVHFIIGIPPGDSREVDFADLEQQLIATTRHWRDELAEALLEHFGEEQGTRLLRRYSNAFRADYREQYPARVARFDIARMEQLGDGADLAMTLYRPPELPMSQLRFKMFHPDRPQPLSDALPMLENMGLKVLEESPSTIYPADRDPVWIHDFGVAHREEDLDLADVAEIFQETFSQVWHGRIENDGFNRLAMRARLKWRQVVVLRAYCKYMRQVRATFSQEYMERALDANQEITRLLVELFEARFDPALAEQSYQRCAQLDLAIESALEAVTSLDEDRILRGFFHVIHATLRTNFYQRDAEGGPKDYVSFKFDPQRVPDMPQPRPRYEIFVYAPRVEGVHLRGGSVARGGLRWSDRREDFRTEILGLVKAQMVKNAVIVPVGSKGGFVCKALPEGGDREAVQAEVIHCYKTFIRGLLDLTDNLVEGAVAPPPDLIRHDGDDPYLVVAADKGTATFSDIANGVARDYGFWLDDAFASGGSAGYDHKKMGITARGAWESVKRHFRELGLDTQAEAFTVFGIGDMSGDVFGNGMLLSDQIRLVAAFDHRHIFIDPEPDAATSFAERQRLFDLPRSSWDDYDRDLISPGGGIWPRSAKSIDLTPEAMRALGVEQSRFTPNELIRTILRAPLDLFWNGGIGTYVKAPTESHGDVGDRSNDTVRVDATELRCRVIGEGGNLGLTQRARIAAATRGIHVISDAIDNSAGVDCSDHEVNIKILLNAVVNAGDMTGKQRNQLLEQMTEEVASLVLRNNYLQTEAISVASAQAPGMFDVHVRLMRRLEKSGALARAIEFLPDDEDIDERRSRSLGLTPPELAVLMAYVKIGLFEALLDSDLPDDADLGDTLVEYFPTPLRERFEGQMGQHRLRREIIATVLSNAVVNRGGMTYVFRLGEETGAGPADLVRAWTIAGRVFRLSGVCADIESLDNRVPAATQTAMLLEVRKLGERATRWLLRHGPRPLAIQASVSTYARGVEALDLALDGLLGEERLGRIRERADHYLENGVDETLAGRVARLTSLLAGLDIVEVAMATESEITTAATVYFTLGEELGLHWLADQITALERDNRWQSLARAALRDDLLTQQRLLTRWALLQTDADAADTERYAQWAAGQAEGVARFGEVREELLGGGVAPDFTMLSVAMQELRALAGSVDDG